MKWLNSLIVAGTLQVLAVTSGHADAKLDQIKQAGTIKELAKHGKNPLAEASFAKMCGRLPSVLGHTARMAWAVDRTAVSTRRPA